MSENPFESDGEHEMPPFIAAIMGRVFGPQSEEDKLQLDRLNAESDLVTHQRLEIFKNFSQEQLEMLRITFRTAKGRAAAYWTGVIDGLLLARSDKTNYCIAHSRVEDPAAALADLMQPPTE